MESEPENGAARRYVLYVEDDPVNAMVMSAMFERRPDLELVVAPTGQQAVFIATGLAPALLLLDLRLPDCHGSQLLPMLRLLPGCETPPAVAVTADGDFDIASTDFCELWSKPLDLTRVLQRLEALLVPRAAPKAQAAATAAS